MTSSAFAYADSEVPAVLPGNRTTVTVPRSEAPTAVTLPGRPPDSESESGGRWSQKIYTSNLRPGQRSSARVNAARNLIRVIPGRSASLAAIRVPPRQIERRCSIAKREEQEASGTSKK